MSRSTGLDSTSLAVLVGLGLCWSLVAPLARIAGQNGVPALFFPAIATLGGVVTLGLLALAQRRALPLTPAHLRLYLLAGTFGHAFPQISLFIAVQHVPIGVVGLAIATTPLFTFALALLMRVEGFSRRRALGLGLGLLGALLVLVPRTALPDPAMIPWVAFSFLTPIAWAISNVFAVVWKPAASDARSSALGMMLISGVVLWLAVLVFGHGHLPHWTEPNAGDVALLLNALVAGLAFVLYFTLLDRTGPVVMSFVSFLNLGLVTLYGIAFFGERPSLWILAAIAAIVAGLEIIRRAPPERHVPQKVR